MVHICVVCLYIIHDTYRNITCICIYIIRIHVYMYDIYIYIIYLRYMKIHVHYILHRYIYMNTYLYIIYIHVNDTYVYITHVKMHATYHANPTWQWIWWCDNEYDDVTMNMMMWQWICMQCTTRTPLGNCVDYGARGQ